MKKVRTYLFATALSCTALTVSAAAAPLTITVNQGNAAFGMPVYQAASCDFNFAAFSPDCLNLYLPNCPDNVLPCPIPGFPCGDTLFPNQPPMIPDDGLMPPNGDQTPPNGDQTPPLEEGVLSDYEAEVARLVNVARQENGLQPLVASGEISRVARAKSQDMVDHNYFSHTSPTYGTPFEMLSAFGVSYQTAGENIAYGQRSAQEVVTTWLNSPGHRANILNANYTQIGVGYVANGNYWTQLFVG